MAKLKILTGGSAGKEFLIERLDTNIGRDKSNDIVLDEPDVSRRHAQIRRENDRYEIIDQGSSNGTSINERLISSCELKDGDLIKFGGLELAFYAEAVAAGPVEAEPEEVSAGGSVEAKASFIRFGVGSDEDMQKLSGVQDKFGPFLMDKTVTLNKIIDFEGIPLKVIKVKPVSGGVIDSATEVDVALMQGDSEKRPVVSGELQKAGSLERFLAYLIDVAVIFVMMFVTIVLAKTIHGIFLILYIAIPVYFLLRDGMFKKFPGQSIGKKVLKIIVVNADTKEPAGLLDSLKRQIFMMIPVLNLVECIMILTNPDGRRLGDNTAGTIVVKKG